VGLNGVRERWLVLKITRRIKRLLFSVAMRALSLYILCSLMLLQQIPLVCAIALTDSGPGIILQRMNVNGEPGY
jgi:hypothetical protein